jgi:hypothetical protein
MYSIWFVLSCSPSQERMEHLLGIMRSWNSSPKSHEPGGKPCPVLTDSAACFVRHFHFTAVDCVVSNWVPFSPCAGTCGSSVKTRTRTILVHWAQGGLMCPSLHDSSPCKHSKPCPIDCTVTEWAPTKPHDWSYAVLVFFVDSDRSSIQRQMAVVNAPH